MQSWWMVVNRFVGLTENKLIYKEVSTDVRMENRIGIEKRGV